MEHFAFPMINFLLLFVERFIFILLFVTLIIFFLVTLLFYRTTCRSFFFYYFFFFLTDLFNSLFFLWSRFGFNCWWIIFIFDFIIIEILLISLLVDKESFLYFSRTESISLSKKWLIIGRNIINFLVLQFLIFRTFLIFRWVINI